MLFIWASHHHRAQAIERVMRSALGLRHSEIRYVLPGVSMQGYRLGPEEHWIAFDDVPNWNELDWPPGLIQRDAALHWVPDAATEFPGWDKEWWLYRVGPAHSLVPPSDPDELVEWLLS